MEEENAWHAVRGVPSGGRQRRSRRMEKNRGQERESKKNRQSERENFSRCRGPERKATQPWRLGSSDLRVDDQSVVIAALRGGGTRERSGMVTGKRQRKIFFAPARRTPLRFLFFLFFNLLRRHVSKERREEWEREAAETKRASCFHWYRAVAGYADGETG